MPNSSTFLSVFPGNIEFKDFSRKNKIQELSRTYTFTLSRIHLKVKIDLENVLKF